MRTIEMSAKDMAPRVARYKELKPLAVQDDPDIPLEAKDLIYARRILSVVGLEGVTTPVNDGAPIKGAGGMTIAMAICPPGQGPSLHSHGTTYETFTVLEGRFEISWNDDGRDSLVLERFDTVSVPPGVSRAFRNVGDKEGILQVLITGGVHDMTDIDFPPSVAEKVAAVHRPALDAFKKAGFTFTAGTDATE